MPAGEPAELMQPAGKTVKIRALAKPAHSLYHHAQFTRGFGGFG